MGQSGNGGTVLAGKPKILGRQPGGGLRWQSAQQLAATPGAQVIEPAGGNPKGRATFGIYKSPLIYRRENY